MHLKVIFYSLLIVFLLIIQFLNLQACRLHSVNFPYFLENFQRGNFTMHRKTSKIIEQLDLTGCCPTNFLIHKKICSYAEMRTCNSFSYLKSLILDEVGIIGIGRTYQKVKGCIDGVLKRMRQYFWMCISSILCVFHSYVVHIILLYPLM